MMWMPQSVLLLVPSCPGFTEYAEHVFLIVLAAGMFFISFESIINAMIACEAIRIFVVITVVK